MGMVAVISRTAGSTSSKRRALTREAERLAAELVEVDRRATVCRWRTRLSRDGDVRHRRLSRRL